ncbi:PQQ-dependent sugar dehydrogenase [Chryseolinea sp. T2]|uniref:PQQ-dependent sugar dehydrogenase n=1 Tax=Chryseolinea sp. T2 TaxID=3129255 RepID=UPI003076C6B0
MVEDSVIVLGAEVFNDHCAGCHGRELQGSIAPALRNTSFRHGSSLDSIVRSIQHGIPGTEMIGWSEVLSSDDINSVATYIIAVQDKPELISRGEKELNLTTKLYKLKIEPLVTEGIEKPWGIAFVDNDHALVTENKGNLRWLVNNKLDPEKIVGIPFSYASDAWGGFMDVAVDPDYESNRWIYLSFSSNKTKSADKLAPGMTKVVRGKITDHRWHDEQTLFQVHDSLAISGGTRWGCRFLIDKEGYLYFSIGDMSRANDSQILTRPAGKIFRINRDGTIPKDNPFYGHKKYLQAIYSWGNRNAQGFAQHPETATIYTSEHGPQGGDELNILKKGENYGWPVITYGIDYDGSKISDEASHAGMRQPITWWTPSIAVGAIDFVDGKMFSKWKNNLLVGALKFEELRRLVVDGDSVKEQEILLKGYGRVRDVTMAPDGSIFVLTNTPDAVLRIVPEEGI